jgi:hypothetical protein
MKVFHLIGFTGGMTEGVYSSKKKMEDALKAHQKTVGCECTFEEVQTHEQSNGGEIKFTECQCGAYDGAVFSTEMEIDAPMPVV